MLTRPGAESRRGEIESIAPIVAKHRELRTIEAPATIDGGDVLRIGRTLYVGQSTRTNAQAVEQLQSLLKSYDYRVVAVRVDGILHLKSAASTLGDDLILCNPAYVDAASFDTRAVFVDEGEPGAANVLRIGDVLLQSSSFPRTRKILEREGFRVETVDYDELEKAEAGVTCCSIIV